MKLDRKRQQGDYAIKSSDGSTTQTFSAAEMAASLRAFAACLEGQDASRDDRSQGISSQSYAAVLSGHDGGLKPHPSRSLALPDPRILEVIVKNRRDRREFFDEDMFADPVWDMLLDLAIASVRHEQVSVTSLCIASGVPASTALRWIAIMEERGLVTKRNDPLDRRRSYITLTHSALRNLARYFTRVNERALPLS